MNLRQGLALLVAIAVLGLIGTVYGRKFFEAPPPPDVIEGEAGWLYPGWDRLADERRADSAAGVRMVAEVTRRLKAKGIPLVVLLIPNKARIVPEHYPADRRALARSGAYKDLVGRLRAAGVTVVDAQPTLAALRASGAPTYFTRDAHWTGQAAEAVAGDVAREVTRLGPLPGQPGDGEQLAAWRIVRRYPDLVVIQRRLGVLKYGEDDFLLRDYVTPPQPPFPVLIVGSSFADRQYGLPEALSHRLDRRVGVHIRFGADGCWQAMVEALKAPMQPAPKVMVWHLGEGSFSSHTAQAAMAAYLEAR